MFEVSSRMKVCVYSEPVNMVRSYTGLLAIVKDEIKQSPFAPTAFAFLNRSKNYMKVLYYEEGGFCLWSKKLDTGLNFQAGSKKQLSLAELREIIVAARRDLSKAA